VERALNAPVAFLVAGTGAYQAELSHSWQAVLAIGAQPVLVSPLGGEIELVSGPVSGGSMHVDVEVAEADATEFAGLVLLSDGAGAEEPDAQRYPAQPEIAGFVQAFFAVGLPVAAIGGAARVLVAADVARGRRLTSAPSLQTELVQAGADWTAERVVVCARRPSVLVTAQDRTDLPSFCQAFTRRFFWRP
jgi:protease I